MVITIWVILLKTKSCGWAVPRSDLAVLSGIIFCQQEQMFTSSLALFDALTNAADITNIHKYFDQFLEFWCPFSSSIVLARKLPFSDFWRAPPPPQNGLSKSKGCFQGQNKCNNRIPKVTKSARAMGFVEVFKNEAWSCSMPCVFFYSAFLPRVLCWTTLSLCTGPYSCGGGFPLFHVGRRVGPSIFSRVPYPQLAIHNFNSKPFLSPYLVVLIVAHSELPFYYLW